MLNDRYGNVLLYALNARGRGWGDEPNEGEIYTLEDLNTNPGTARPATAEHASFEMHRTPTKATEDETGLNDGRSKSYFNATNVYALTSVIAQIRSDDPSELGKPQN